LSAACNRLCSNNSSVCWPMAWCRIVAMARRSTTNLRARKRASSSAQSTMCSAGRRGNVSGTSALLLPVLVAFFVLIIGRIQAGQFCPLLHLLHQPALQQLVLGSLVGDEINQP